MSVQMLRPTEDHYKQVLRNIKRGGLVTLLGAGANLSDRAEGEAYVQGQNLPSGAELAERLAEEHEYPEGREDRCDLLRVAQFAQMNDESYLRDSLHDVFGATYGPTSVHRFLAGLPERTGQHQLVLTTNYDDALEQAYRAVGEPFSTIYYRAVREGRCWVREDGTAEPQLIEKPSEDTRDWLADRSVILKVHGAVDREERRAFNDSYVISEDHYIDFLATVDLETLVPKKLLVHLANSAVLFLGYSLVDWNLRVLLRDLWSRRDVAYPAWAIQLAVDPLDRAVWDHRQVDIFEQPLAAYVAQLEERLGNGAASG